MSPVSTPAAVLGHRLADVLHGVGSTVDRDAEVPPRLIDELARSGALAAMVPAEYGGRPLGFAEYGRLCALVAAESAALQSLLTVHGMVCLSIARWAGADARARFLPRLAAGELLGAFALSEEEAGSDMRAIRTTATAGPTAAAGRLVNGQKKWISFGTAAASSWSSPRPRTASWPCWSSATRPASRSGPPRAPPAFAAACSANSP